MIQDVEIPLEHAPAFAQFFNKEIGIKPVWICPVAAYDPSVSYPLYPMNPRTLYVNFGFWDAVRTDHEEGYFNKKVEAKVRELGGKKSLYSNSFYSREEFWQLYDETSIPQAQSSLRSDRQTEGSVREMRPHQVTRRTHLIDPSKLARYLFRDGD